MKRILFLLLFCFFGGGLLFADSGQGPEKIVVNPLFNFDEIYVTLREILIQLFFEYYYLVLGFVAVLLLLYYFQGMLESRQMRRVRERREQEYRRDCRDKNEMRQIEKQLARERDLIRRYARVDAETALRIQNEMYRKESNEHDEEELVLASVDDDVFPSNNIDRAGTFWRSDGSEEGSNSFSEDTVSINESSTVIIPAHKRKQDRFYRGMEDDDNGGY